MPNDIKSSFCGNYELLTLGQKCLYLYNEKFMVTDSTVKWHGKILEHCKMLVSQLTVLICLKISHFILVHSAIFTETVYLNRNNRMEEKHLCCC